MEAKTLKKKKTGISKAKVKKTIKNILCRPDTLFWPTVTEEHANILQSALEKYKVDIPDFKKPHWNEIKNLPKQKRPRPPKLKKVEGLIFGINDSKTAINNKYCSAVIVESSVNPRAIVQPLIDSCISNNIPVLCLNNLKKLTATCFGIPTSCLSLHENCFKDLKTEVITIAQSYKPPNIVKKIEKEPIETDNIKSEEGNTEVKTTCPYLYRKNKKTRVFNPSLLQDKVEKAFIGQDFIKFPEKSAHKPDSKTYMTMVLKRIAGNQNRVQKK